MIRILLADDQIPEKHLVDEREIFDHYQSKYSPGFASGFVFMKNVVAKLTDLSYEIRIANTIRSTDELIQKQEFDIAIIDLGWYADPNLSDLSHEEKMNRGWGIAEKLAKLRIPTIMCSNRFPTHPEIVERAAELKLFPVYKSYDDTCIKNLLTGIKYCIAQIPDLGRIGSKVFIGHGRSKVWHDLKDFVSDRLKLPWDEFNRESSAGLPVFERLSQMLDNACFAFLVMTAEDEHSDATLHARENVVHEIGLFQGRLGPSRAIILLEDGCKEFSNVIGLSQIRFPKGELTAKFEDIRSVLEREGLI